MLLGTPAVVPSSGFGTPNGEMVYAWNRPGPLTSRSRSVMVSPVTRPAGTAVVSQKGKPPAVAPRIHRGVPGTPRNPNPARLGTMPADPLVAPSGTSLGS